MDSELVIRRMTYAGLLIFIALFTWFVIHTDKKREKALKGSEAVATIYGKDHRRLRFRYVVNKTEQFTSSQELDPEVYRSYKIGDKYLVKYAPEDPQWGVILYHKPVIDGTEFGSTKSVSIRGSGKLAWFEYFVNYKKYSRCQVIDPDRDFHPESYQQDAYLVRYNMTDPSIGYIFLDSIMR